MYRSDIGSVFSIFMRIIAIIGLTATLLFQCSESVREIKSDAVLVEIPEVLVVSSNGNISKRRNGDVYYNGIPYSGYLIEYYLNDTLALKNGYFNGKLNGMSTAYYENGSTRYLRPYQDGEKHGTHIGFHKNGTKAFEYLFVKGFSEGNHKEWFNNGQLAADMNYVQGKELGTQRTWRPDGKLRSNYVVRENGRRYGLQGIKRCTKLDGVTKSVDPYKGRE